ncbi:hypothetical protein F441_18479 [Phytophthora nicotianae CJ01A1]|uniref:Uncharacterized protein n=3 Tax=Phytophthora nicotianae TaxID=4792 RepID=V9E9S5_PHYNI|nr:hypothetical protein F443_18614 [Phytophthora nicotianae P1569]ETO63768.1 hypothetical protein F444_18611 [Phytophthora nicotianae P1976]ETP04829.1 hypothetical protein F441_18479 [Phytophthora nicotianae CJ01A1]
MWCSHCVEHQVHERTATRHHELRRHDGHGPRQD